MHRCKNNAVADRKWKCALLFPMLLSVVVHTRRMSAEVVSQRLPTEDVLPGKWHPDLDDIRTVISWERCIFL